MKALTTCLSFFKSRQKVLLLRRKRQVKNRPMSKKRLQEERSAMNYSYEVKLMQTKKELDRRKSQNHHINEIIQQLFYPEINLQSQEDVAARAKQLSQHNIRIEQLLNSDRLTQQIAQLQLPVDLLEYHAQNRNQFEARHYKLWIQRIGYYCGNRQNVQKRTTEAWQRLIKQLQKQKDLGKKPQCPYLFLIKQQISRHELWQELQTTLLSKLQQSQKISQLNAFIPTLLAICRIFGFIPAELYQTLMNRNVLVPFNQLQPEHISGLFKLLRNRLKLRFGTSVKVEGGSASQSQENTRHFGSKLAQYVMVHPDQFTIIDFINIFKVVSGGKKRMNILPPQLLQKSQQIIKPVLGNLRFSDVQTYTNIYALFNPHPNAQFLQILEYDLYRKADQQSHYYFIYSLISKIKQRKLTYLSMIIEGQTTQLQAYDLLTRLAKVISSRLSDIAPHQLLQLLDVYFDNQLQDISAIEVLSTQIVKRGKQLPLQSLAKSFFKLTLLGHKSKILTKFVVNEYSRKYHDQMKKIIQQGTLLLPTQQGQSSTAINFKQIHLQECLLMILWSTVHQLGDTLSKTINLQTLLTLIPIKTQSKDPLAIELAININSKLEQYSLFPTINWPVIDKQFPSDRLKEYYSRDFMKEQLQLLFRQQAKVSGLFVGNCHAKEIKFIAQKWSGERTYNIEDYLTFCMRAQGKQGKCFFGQADLPQEFIQKRTELTIKNENYNSQSSGQKKGTLRVKKDHKLYDLLI